MAKFKFELQDVLDFRNYEKEAAESELAKALAVENQINAALESIANEYVQLKNYMKSSKDIEDILSQDRHIKLLDFQKEQLLNELTEAKIVSEEKRNILRECMKKTTALEKLKEKQLELFKAAEDYKESELMDDLAVTRYKSNN